jgi:CRP-like cAMP-binding protein
MLFLDNIMS